jgi:hypothetical protein
MYNMPYTMRKVRRKPCFKVYNQKTKRVYSKCTSKEKAQKQIKLLNAIKYNKDFVPRKAPTRGKKNKKINPLPI